MNKKIFMALGAFALMACSQEEQVMTVNDQVTLTITPQVSYTINQPQTKANDTYVKCIRLGEDGQVLDTNTVPVGQSLTITATTGESFSYAFWADDSEEYTGETVDLTKFKDGQWAQEYITADANKNVTVNLTRPFSRLVLEASDAELMPENAKLKISNLYKSFNIVGGYAEGEMNETEVELIKTASDREGYTTVADLYLIAVDNMANVNIGGLELVGINFRANYQTTVYGSFFGSNVSTSFKLQDLSGESNVSYWFGGLKKPEITNNSAIVVSADELAWLANNDVDGLKSISLCADLNLNNREWTPLNINGIEFNGNGHIISNIKVNQPSGRSVGFFGECASGKAYNFTLNNVDITGRLGVGAIAGKPYTGVFNDIKVMGDVKISGKFYVGGAFGYQAYGNLTEIHVLANDNSYVYADSNENGTLFATYVGGFVGFFGEGTQKITRCTTNVNVTGGQSRVGGFSGNIYDGMTLTECVANNEVNISDVKDDLYGTFSGSFTNAYNKQAILDECYVKAAKVDKVDGFIGAALDGGDVLITFN